MSLQIEVHTVVLDGRALACFVILAQCFRETSLIVARSREKRRYKSSWVLVKLQR